MFSWNCPDLTVCHVGDHLFFPFAVCKIPTKATTFVSWWKVHNFYASVKVQDLTKPELDISLLFEKLSQQHYKASGQRQILWTCFPFWIQRSCQKVRQAYIQISNVVLECFGHPTPPKNKWCKKWYCTFFCNWRDLSFVVSGFHPRFWGLLTSWPLHF